VVSRGHSGFQHDRPRLVETPACCAHVRLAGIRSHPIRQAKDPHHLAGNFANPSFGKTVLRPEGDALVLEIKVSGAKLKLDPWDGDIFTAKLMPTGRFAAVVENEGPRPSGFVQFQIDKDGKLNLLRLSFDDGQAYEFRRE
jgi:Domain of unknown function (DUF3471)